MRASPGLEARTGARAAVATAEVPLVLDDRPLGTVGFDIQEFHSFMEKSHCLRTLAAQCAPVLGQARPMTDRQGQARSGQLKSDARAQEAFVVFTEAVGTETDLLALARQAITVLQTRFPDGQFSYFSGAPGSGRWQAQVWSENHSASQIAMITSGFPEDTPIFAQVLRHAQPVFRDGWDAGREQIEHTQEFGMGATYPLLVGGAVRGILGMAVRHQRRWAARDRALVQAVGRGLTLALERAEQARQLQARGDELEEERAALDAFVAFSEAAGTETDVAALAERAVTALTLRFPGCSSAYYELEGGRWTLQLHNDDLNGQLELRAALRAGLPRDTPSFAQALKSMRPVFVENWDAAQEQIARTEAYGAVANAPLVQGGEVRAILSLGLRGQRQWPERDRAVFRAVARGLTLALERAGQARQLQARQAEEARRSQALEAFAELSRDLALEADPLTLVRRAQEVVQGLLPPGFSGYYEPQDGLWRMRSQVGHANTPELQVILDAGLPFEATTNLLIPWRSGVPHYQNEYDPALDGLTGSDDYPGASVTIPIVVNGQTRGVLGFAPYTARFWSGEDRAVLDTVGRQLTLALERAEQTRRLAEEREALEAFARFTEASTHTTDALTLAEGARDVLRATIGVEAGYAELEGGLWTGRVSSEWTFPEIRAPSAQGFPADHPVFARPFVERAVVFVDNWMPQDAQHTEVYGAAALYPYFGAGQPRGLLTMGTTRAQAWTARERSVFRSVGRSLALAFERAEAARHLQAQNAELAARTRALEGFAELTRDLSTETDRLALVRRAQEVALSLLPAGYALYFEPEGDWWALRAQTGELRSEALQAAADQGFAFQGARNLLMPYTSLTPYYQERYDIGTGTIGEQGAHLGATASFPVLIQGQPRGVLAVVLFGGARPWSRPDQAALESVVRSLGLALERAEGLAQLEARTRQVTQWRERYEVAIQGSGHLLYDWDPVTDEIVYGGAVEAITGYAPQELSGALSDWTATLIHPDDRETFSREIERVRGSGEAFHLAFRVIRKDGTVARVEDDGYFKRDASGELTRMVGFVQDVTERQRAQAELLQVNGELRRSNAELEQFAYIASHDLQAPIRAVSSFADILAQKYSEGLDERGQRYLRFISESGGQMKQLVDDLLTYSRVATEQRPPAPTDSRRIFERVRQRLTTEMELLGAQVSAGALPVVPVDASQLDQLLQNLIGNALKYHRPGVPPQVQVSAERRGDLWQFAVSDNGLGIQEQYFEKIFAIFQRLHGREAYEGTGIGLAVCKKIVERHGGQLWVRSRLGEGSTFLFTLPAA